MSHRNHSRSFRQGHTSSIASDERDSRPRRLRERSHRHRELSPYSTYRKQYGNRSNWQSDSCAIAEDSDPTPQRDSYSSRNNIRRYSDPSRLEASRSIYSPPIHSRDRERDPPRTPAMAQSKELEVIDPVSKASSVAAQINAKLLARDLVFRNQQQQQQQLDEEDQESRDYSSSSSASKMSLVSAGSEDTGYDSPQPVPSQNTLAPVCVMDPDSVEPTSATPASASTSSNRTHYTRDVDINQYRSKHLLTKSSTQAEIQAETGCSVTSRGRFMYDGDSTGGDKPLHLHLEGPSTESISAAVNKIQAIMHQDMENDHFHRNQGMYVRSVTVIDNSGLTPFQLRGLVVGPQGENIKHIQQASGCRIQIKGIGSRYLEGDTEEQVPLYVHVSGHDKISVDIAEHLILDLMRVVESSAHKRYRMNSRR